MPRSSLWWLRLDHPLFMNVALGALCRRVIDAQQATADNPVYLFLDELTYSTEWDLWLKTFYDEMWPVRVAGSSSSTAALRGRRLESGVGRWEEQYLAPYLFSEYLELMGHPVEIPVGESLTETIENCIRERVDVSEFADDRRRFLLTGGFPELLIHGSLKEANAEESSILLQSQRILRNDAVERAIYKDIPQAFGVDNPMVLERVLYTLAGQVTGILSPQTICQIIGGVSQPTFLRYLSYLERAFLVFAVPNYSGSEASTQKRGRKLYFVDGAVRNAALQRGLAPLTDMNEMGLLIENMVAGHLRALGEETQTRLYYWRDRNDELDFVFDHPENPIAFEIGLSPGHHRRGIVAFTSRYPRFEGRCYMVSGGAAAVRPQDHWDKIGTIPLDLLLLAIGAQAEKELERRMIGG
jgi:predicted AAA+ superfamily ATPase